MTVSSVLHINTADNDGGAARSGYRIHTELRRNGLRSRMFVRSKGTLDPDVQEISPRPFSFLADKLFDSLWRLTSLQYFYYPSSFNLLKHPWYQEADLVQLYNTHGNYFSLQVLPSISIQKPIVWRLSDMWPLTGHCAYSYDCEKWKTGCGGCPLLSEYPALFWDTTAKLWKVKKDIYSKSNITLVAPSSWIENIARQSPLLSSFPIHRVPNGIDAESFKPGNKKLAKEKFGLDPEKPVVLLMDSGPGGERKGRDLLPEIVRGIKSKYNDEVTFLIFGAGSDEWKNKNYSHVYSAGRVQGNENLNFLYNASDLFVFPTKAENLANVALESMACGTPVATFRSGGMMDLIMDGQNGILANPLGTQQIIKLINLLLSDKNQLIQFAHSSRQKILDHFTKEKEASKILDIYNSVLSQTSKR